MWLLAGLASVRTWRLLVVDSAGRWVRYRFDSMVWMINPKAYRTSVIIPRRKDVSKWTYRRHRLAKSLAEGYNCPFCLGFWLTVAWVATGLAWSDTRLWQLAAGSFALSYVVGHLGAELDAGDADVDSD